MPLIGDPATFMKFGGDYPNLLYVEADESPTANYSGHRGQITRSVYVGWEDRDTAALAFAGTAEVKYTLAGHGYITRKLPHAYPPKTYMRVNDVLSVEPVALRGTDGNPLDGTGVAKYQQAKLLLQYAFPTYFFKTDEQVWGNDDFNPLKGYPDEGEALEKGHSYSRFVTKVENYSTRELIIPQLGPVKNSNGRPLPEGIAVREAVGTIIYTHHLVPITGVPARAKIAAGACVNDATFDGFAAGTLLFQGSSDVIPEPSVIDGQFYANVQYRFEMRAVYDRSTDIPTVRGWNYIRDTTGSGESRRFIPLLLSTSGVRNQNEERNASAAELLFPPFDFKRLFRPDPIG